MSYTSLRHSIVYMRSQNEISKKNIEFVCKRNSFHWTEIGTYRKPDIFDNKQITFGEIYSLETEC